MSARPKKFDAIYARYSSHMQDGGTSIEVQLDACHANCGPTYKDYIDKARTGRAIAGRDALRSLMADAEAGLVARLFVYKYDRIGRTSETHTVVADFEDLGVEVISVTEGREALSRGIQLVVAEHFSKQLGDRTRDGLIKRFEQGYWTGGKPPYGYKLIDDDEGQGSRDKKPRLIVINDEEVEHVKAIFATYLSESKGLKSTAQALDAKAIPPREVDHWTHTSVRDILTNETYLGVVKFRRCRKKIDRKSGRKLMIPNDESEHLRRTDENLRIIDDEQFEQVQQRLKSRSKRQAKSHLTPSIWAFTKVLVCGCCGKPFYSTRTTAKGHEYRHYVCGTRQRLGTDSCQNKTRLNEDKLINQVMNSFEAVFDDADAIVDEAVKKAETLIESNRSEAARLRKELKDLAKQRDADIRLIDDPDINDLAKEAIAEHLGEVQEKRKALQSSLDRLGEEANLNTERLAKAVRRAFAEAKESFANVASPAQVNEFVLGHIGQMTVGSDGSLSPGETALDAARADLGSIPEATPRAGLEPAT